MADKPLKLLLIEDDKDDIASIQEMLRKAQKASFSVEVRDVLVKGLECLEKNWIDIVLLDLTLPDSLGLDTFGRIHAHAPNVPIIVITSSSDETQALMAFQKGAQDYLVKGQIDANLLERSIRYAIERNRIKVELHDSEGRLKQSAERLAKINKCFLDFGENPSSNICRLTALFGEMLGATCALYNSIDADNMLCSVGQWNTPEGYNPRDKPEGHICYDVIKKGDGKVFLVRNLQETEYARTDPIVKRYNLKTYLGYPIKWNDKVVGSLCAVYQTDFVPNEEDLKLVDIIAAALEVEEKRRRSELELQKANQELLNYNKRLTQLSLRDLHTGLYNHRYLAEIIDSEFYRAKKYSHPMSIIMLDVDYFKSINETYGHKFGDTVIKQLAQQLRKMIRRYDIVIRYGGEEFIIISPGTDRKQALALAERILDGIGLFNFGDRKIIIKLKVSLAVVSYPEDKVSGGMDLVKISEQLLTRAKEEGGNRAYSSMDRKLALKWLGRYGRTDTVGALKRSIDKLHKEANESLIESIFAFAKTIEVKDHYTGEHGEQTVAYATGIAKELGLSSADIEMVKQAAMLHDLGKIGISENILTKKTKLTKKELHEIRKHPAIAADILRPVHVLNAIVPFILYHHERWDGKGYQGGLKAEEIPLGARIIAIADVYQALISNRPYRKALSKAEAEKMIKEGSGTQFDPKIVSIFLNILKKEKK